MEIKGMSPQAKALFDQFHLLKPVEGTPVKLEVEREKTRHAEEMTGVPSGVRFERARVAGITGIWCIPETSVDDFRCVYLHGGGFGLMSASTHARMAGHLANACRTRVFVPNYRLAPEHPFPDGLRDCVKVIVAIGKASGGGPVAVVGDSAGGGLVVSATLSLRDSRKPLPLCLVLMSPWLDLTHGSPSIVSNVENEASLRESNLRYFADLYLDGTSPKDPLVSPIYANCESLPPTYIQAAGHDLVRDDGIRFSERLRLAGVPVRLDLFEQMQHSFQFYAGRIPEADEALRLAAGYIRDILGRKA